MKRKTQKPTATTAASSATIPAELKVQIHEHRLFFDKLIEVIPAKFYLPNDDDSKPWYPGLSKQKKASLRKQTKENIKLSRRQRLDPYKASETSTLHLLEKHNRPEDDGDEENQTKPITFDEDAGGGDGQSLTWEELRERFRLKLECLRGNRGSGDAERRKEMKGKGIRDNKRKRDEGESGKSVDEEKAKHERRADEGIEFGKVKLGDEEKRGKKKKKMSKVKELEKAKRLKEVKKENPYVAKKESWKAAMSRATGGKVHDDPRLLKESLKKDKKRREKNAEKWKERVERTEKMKDERQQKRKNNIAERARDKKARKIAKREKKLMRPGFEGRKEGYITQD